MVIKSEDLFKSKIAAPFLALFATFLFGSVFPVIKITNEMMMVDSGDIPSQLFTAGIRYFLAGLFMVIYLMVIKKEKPKLTKNKMLVFFGIALIYTYSQKALFYIGTANTTGMKSALLMASSTLFTVFISPLFFKNDKITTKKIISLILGFTGIIFINLSKDFSLDFTIMGDGFLILVGLLGSFSIIAVKISSVKIHPAEITGFNTFIGGFLLIMTGVINLDYTKLNFSFLSFALILYLSVVTVIGPLIMNTLYKYHKAGEISFYGFGTPLFGSILSAVLLPNESFTFNIVIALFLIILSLLILNSKRKVILKNPS